MDKPAKPEVGTCVAVIHERYDSSGERTSFERWHGVVESVNAEGYLLTLGGVRHGQDYLIPISGELRPLPGGHFHFEESDEWVAPLFMYKTETRQRS